MKLLPDNSYKIAFFACLALALYGAYSLFTEPMYPEGGWFALGLGVAGAALTLYKGGTRRTGR